MKSVAPTVPSSFEHDKRRQIIDGARAIFLAQGFDAASMGEIAREAGVSKGTLYVYFDSKEGLAAAHDHQHLGADARGRSAVL